MMHCHTRLWRATALVFALLLLAVPGFAAKRHKSHRTKVVHKATNVSRHSPRPRVATRPRHTARAGTTHHRARLVASNRGSAPAGGAYTVRRGDTLAVIAKRHGTTPQALARANGLRSIHRIAEGQVLRLPGSRVARHLPAASLAKAEHGPGAACDSNDLVRTALKYKGVPYRYAGITSRGLDCSGLVARVLMAHGVRAPHHAASLYKMGRPVSSGNLRSGDLVFFNTTGAGISHVGIYTGDGKFVHASSGGGKVMVSSLREGYYQRRYVGARRIAPS